MAIRTAADGDQPDPATCRSGSRRARTPSPPRSRSHRSASGLQPGDRDVDDRVERPVELRIAVRRQRRRHPRQELGARSAGHEDTVAEPEPGLVRRDSGDRAPSRRRARPASRARLRGRARGHSPARGTRVPRRSPGAPRGAGERRSARPGLPRASRGRPRVPARTAPASPRTVVPQRGGPGSAARPRTAGQAPRRPPSRPRHRARGSRAPSPAAGVSNDPVENPRGNGAPVVGGRADIVDRAQLRREGLGGGVGHLRASDERPRAPPRRRRRGSAWPPLSRGRPGRRTSLPKDRGTASSPRSRPSRWPAHGGSRPSGSASRGPATSGIRTWRISSSGSSAVCRYAGEELGRRYDPLAAMAPDHDRRVHRQQHRQRVAGRRGVRDVAAERAAVLDLGRTDRSRLPRQAPADAHGRGSIGGSPCTSSARRGRGPPIPGRSPGARRDATGRASGPATGPISPLIATMMSVPPAIGTSGPAARSAYASDRCDGTSIGGSAGTLSPSAGCGDRARR